MKVLLLGAGMQGKAALHDLVASEQVTEIVVADRDLEALGSHVTRLRESAARSAHASGESPGEVRLDARRLRCERVDGSDPASLERLLRERPDVVIDLMPPMFTGEVAACAVRHGVHVVNTSYTRPDVLAQADAALARGVTILPEFGMDPGIDLVLMGHAVREFDQVEVLRCYGGGIPEPAAAHDPIQYKITWTFEGVLKAYRRAGRVVRGGEVVEIADRAMFSPENVHALEISGLGTFEAFPNGDAIRYVELLGLDRSRLRELGRFTLRWPGHCAFWKKLVDLHLLDDEPVKVDGAPVDRRRYLTAALSPHLRYEEGERDLAIIRIDVCGSRGGQSMRAVHQVIDRRDLATGISAMSRTVGFTASIGAHMIGTGEISKRGLLSPVRDVPYARLVEELARRGIQVTRELAPWDPDAEA
jgi:lysine 6-dehydrogenase